MLICICDVQAAILQQAVDYISYLMHERQQLLELNRQCMAAKVGTSIGAIEDCGNGRRCPMSPIPLVKRRKSSECEESSDDCPKLTTTEVTECKQDSSSLTAPTTIIRDRLKRRLPSQEATVDCDNTEQVARTLHQNSNHLKDEVCIWSIFEQYRRTP